MTAITVDGMFYVDVPVMVLTAMFDWSEVMGGYNTADTVVRDRRTVN